MPAFTQILYEVSEGIATITLHRPEKMNAFTRTMMDEMIAAFDLADADDAVRCVIVTGHGDRAFCAGADLKAMAGADGARDGDWGSPRGMIDLPLALRALPQPSVCAVNGVAAGAGAKGVAVLVSCNSFCKKCFSCSFTGMITYQMTCATKWFSVNPFGFKTQCI